jgi:hypothetical protein
MGQLYLAQVTVDATFQFTTACFSIRYPESYPRIEQTDHGWKHDHLRILVETEGCNCSLKELLMMGMMMPETC